jgi:hypothetical protein
MIAAGVSTPGIAPPDTMGVMRRALRRPPVQFNAGTVDPGPVIAVPAMVL